MTGMDFPPTRISAGGGALAVEASGFTPRDPGAAEARGEARRPGSMGGRHAPADPAAPGRISAAARRARG